MLVVFTESFFLALIALSFFFFLSKMLKLCGETEEKLAQELLVFECQMERDVVDPLYSLAEVSVPLSQHSTTPDVFRAEILHDEERVKGQLELFYIAPVRAHLWRDICLYDTRL